MTPSQLHPKLISMYEKILQYINALGDLKRLVAILIVIHIIGGAVISPILTTDFQRNLFYGKAFWEHGFKVYDMRPLDIDENYDIVDPISGKLSYPNITYAYPTIQLIFWAGISLLPFSDIIGKWVLSLFDIINFALMFTFLKRQKKDKDDNGDTLDTHEKAIILSYLFFSIPFSAIEGQSTSLTIFFLIIPIFLHQDHPFLSYLCVGLGFHWKYVPFVVLPYLIFQDIDNRKRVFQGTLISLSTIIILSSPLLVSDFTLHYLFSLGRLDEYADQTLSNPLLFSQLYISSILTTVILVIGLLSWLGSDIPKHKIHINFKSLIEKKHWIPFILVMGFLKVYKTAFPWYWMWFYPLLVIFPEDEGKFITKMLGISFSFAIVDFIDITVGITSLLDVLSNLLS